METILSQAVCVKPVRNSLNQLVHDYATLLTGRFSDGTIYYTATRKSTLSSSRKRKRIATLARKYGERCQHCGAGEDLTLDHIKPLSKGGKDGIYNLQLLCKTCNEKKADNYEMKEGKEMGAEFDYKEA